MTGARHARPAWDLVIASDHARLATSPLRAHRRFPTPAHTFLSARPLPAGGRGRYRSGLGLLRESIRLVRAPPPPLSTYSRRRGHQAQPLDTPPTRIRTARDAKFHAALPSNSGLTGGLPTSEPRTRGRPRQCLAELAQPFLLNPHLTEL